MKYALIDVNDIVKNIIVYDDVSPYDPSPLIVTQVNDWVNIGDHKDIAEPTPTPEVE